MQVNLPELCMYFGVPAQYLHGTCTYLQMQVILPEMCMYFSTLYLSVKILGNFTCTIYLKFEVINPYSEGSVRVNYLQI